MASGSVTLKALGLQLSPNQLEIPAGSLQTASNVIIRRDNVIESRRGFKLYGNSFGVGSDRAKQLMSYKTRLLRHFSNILQFDTGTTDTDGVEQFASFSGNYLEPQTGLRIKSVESNGNFYFTSSEGIMKIAALTASDLSTSSGFITKAGGIKAIDQTATLVITPGQSNGFLPQDSAVAYRIVWGTKDANGNLILGTPSQRTVIYNSLLNLLIHDLITLLEALNACVQAGGNPSFNGTGLTGTTYVNQFKLQDTADATTLRTTLINLATQLNTDSGTTNFTSPSIITPAAPNIPATDNDLVAIQTYLSNIIGKLQANNTPPGPAFLSASNLANFIIPLAVTTTANVKLVIDIPQGITNFYFFQIYRSPIAQATGTEVLLRDVFPNDELQQVYEAFPTLAELSSHSISVIDSTPAALMGASLYTNQFSGEGILQANEAPPFALDINRFKNVVFYANTRTKEQLNFNLLGVQKMITDYNNGIIPTITIADTTTFNTYQFTIGVVEKQTVTCNAGGTLAASGTASYFLLDSATNQNLTNKYYVWYKIGTATDPTISGRTGIQITATAGDTNTKIAQETCDGIADKLDDFITSISSNVVTITNVNVGYTTAATDVSTGFTFAVTQIGKGERASTHEILLSTNTSIALAIDETAQSFVRIINENQNELIYAYYLSSGSGTSLPGQIFLEERTLSSNPFYIVGNNSNTGLEFNPDISPTLFGTVASGNPAIITSVSNGLINQDQIELTHLPNSTSPDIGGIYQVTFINSNSFSISVNVTSVSNSSVSFIKLTDAVSSTNLAFPNRIYYSKLQQPEAVPSVNFFDVGAKDKAILRIMPLRDSLFIFKEDGLYRISGEAAPFVLSLFDNSAILIASDSLGIANNLIYSWTQQGITVVSEAGVSNPPISRPIDTAILQLATYSNFSTATWGVGYPSDNSYIVYTVNSPTDTEATIAYRYGNLTNTWTTWDKTNTCGIVNPTDDRLYLGAGDTNFIEQERKSFTRQDYADRQFDVTINKSTFSGNTIILPVVSNIAVGDVLYQSQTVGVFEFNGLLQKLDDDVSLAVVNITSITTGSTQTITTSTNHNLTNGQYVKLFSTNSTPSIDGTYKITFINTTQFTVTPGITVTIAGTSGKARFLYLNNLKAFAGDDLKIDLLTLTAKLDSDPNTIYKNYTSDISPKSGSITAITAANPTIITSAGHGLKSNRVIDIIGSNSNPTIDGTRTVTVTSSSTFTIPVSVISVGSSGTFTTEERNFNDLEACYDLTINSLNIDTGVTFSNYPDLDQPGAQETIVTAVNIFTKQITLNLAVDYLAGTATIFKAIPCDFTYSQITMNDPLNMKQIYESTLMFSNKAFTSATLSFSTDLLPVFIPVPFNGDGNGIFGNKTFGLSFFGGGSHGAPFRTLIPATCQRCRYITVQYDHMTAREQWAIYGITLTGNMGISTRAYR